MYFCCALRKGVIVLDIGKAADCIAYCTGLLSCKHCGQKRGRALPSLAKTTRRSPHSSF